MNKLKNPEFIEADFNGAGIVEAKPGEKPEPWSKEDYLIMSNIITISSAVQIICQAKKCSQQKALKAIAQMSNKFRVPQDKAVQMIARHKVLEEEQYQEYLKANNYG